MGNEGITTVEFLIKHLYGSNYEKRSKKHEEIADAIKLLSVGRDDNDSYIDTLYISGGNNLDIKYNSEIKYELCEYKDIIGYTILTYSEFDSLIYFCKEWNTDKRNSKVDSVIIFNLYLLFKMYIQLTESNNKRTGEKGNFHISVSRLGSKTGLDKNTMQKYINVLDSIGFISVVNRGSFKNRQSNEYALSNVAIQKYEALNCEAASNDYTGIDCSCNIKSKCETELEEDFPF